MILQFIGFFVVLACGAWAVLWAGRELWYYITRFTLPIGDDDLIDIGIITVGLCVGCGLLYYTGTHAPFEITFDLKIK